MSGMNDATRAQVSAARPDVSTWVGANAGSGKTRVLTDRVARLLLDGVEPQKILCLTYTKAAASEMQNRLFRRLGEWAMLDNDTLSKEMHKLGLGQNLPKGVLRDARTLFARAIETPGGLKVQTIHSFCATLLRRFPLEARVSPNFQEMDDRAGSLLRAEIVRDMAEGPHRQAMEAIAMRLSGSDFDEFTQSIVMNRAGFQGDHTRITLAPLFGVEPTAKPEDVLPIAFTGAEAALAKDICELFPKQGAATKKFADGLAKINLTQPSIAAHEALVPLFRDSNNGPFKVGRIPQANHHKVREAVAHLIDDIDAWIERTAAAHELLNRIKAWEATADLHAFAKPFIEAYQSRKLVRGWLDFDDLILKARDLLSRSEVASWVLYRLDGGIDHILVDEAQDTNPLQWQVIDLLSQEFTSGEGANSNKQRTIFVVGDKKQSIYSFQGADPKEFDRMRLRFSERLDPIGTPLVSTSLRYSFRSSKTILSLVDHTFTDREGSGFEANSSHIAFHDLLPGRVDLWPLVEPADKEKPPEDATVDWVSPDHHDVRLARQIAQEIRNMIGSGATIPETPKDGGPIIARPVRAGDFLILVQRRSALFAHIIKACKEEGLPIAGSDRLKVGAELAVRDLAALLSAVATPEDDLSLATALRSPLFGWSEQQIFTLAHARDDKSLWAALQEKTEDHAETVSILADLAAQSDYLRPYDLIERILIRHDGRRKLLARLGTEAEDGIDALLSQALAYEQNDIPSLTGFLGWIETDDLEIKRQFDGDADEIRVMTVHGAKGLEAPIVILPDTMDRRDQNEKRIVLHDGLCWWWPNAAERPEMYNDIRETRLGTVAAERDRLLYVALTRAEKWLILAGSGSLKEDSSGWYAQLQGSMTNMGATPHAYSSGQGLRMEDEGWHALPLDTPKEKSAPQTKALDPLFHLPARRMPKPQGTVRPSSLGGEHALPGEGRAPDEAMSFGSLVHLLLEKLPGLPPSLWPEAAVQLASGFDPAALAPALEEARRTIQSPNLAQYFTQGLVEVPISATLPELGRVFGKIDRLIVAADHVLAIDYKTNSVVPASESEVPEGLLRQMAAYSAALSAVYPEKRIETAFIWTSSTTFMPLSEHILRTAYVRATTLDAPRPSP
jgi:ATP-dependent helicase/nuclease subunit A